MSDAVFVDTSGAYALLDPTDPDHARARAAFLRSESEGRELITTNYVVHESWALIQARLGWEALGAWRDAVIARCRIIWVDERLHSVGEARCRQAKQRRLSLTDCVSFEVMRQHRLHFFIGDDEHFEREGFEPFA
jgi:uncharacterized protein